jgi:hypothetical protein
VHEELSLLLYLVINLVNCLIFLLFLIITCTRILRCPRRAEVCAKVRSYDLHLLVGKRGLYER